jgi:hypothetical protein
MGCIFPLQAFMNYLENCYVSKLFELYLCLFGVILDLHAMDEKMFNDFLIWKWMCILYVIKSSITLDLYSSICSVNNLIYIQNLFLVCHQYVYNHSSKTIIYNLTSLTRHSFIRHPQNYNTFLRDQFFWFQTPFLIRLQHSILWHLEFPFCHIKEVLMLKFLFIYAMYI